MNLYKETHNGRECLFGYSDEDSVTECLKEALSKGIISENKKLFFGYSRFFAIKLDGNYIQTCRMRENWNGWHDCAIYETEGWLSVGNKVYANPSKGLHRDTVNL